MMHVVKVSISGNDSTWSCSCGKSSRHQLPWYRTEANAKAHERKHRKTAGVVLPTAVRP